MNAEKSKVLDRLQEDWLAFKFAVDDVPEDKLEMSGVAGDWSVKDLIGHIVTWEEVGIKRAKDVSQEREYEKPYDNVDDFNVEEAARKAHLSLKAIKSQFLQVHERYMDLLRGIQEECFSEDYKYGPATSPLSPKHKANHAEDIRRWLAGGGLDIPS